MTIVKSLHASLFSNIFTFRDKHYFNVSTVWGFKLTDSSAIAEQNYWEIIGKYSDNTIPFDEGYCKQKAEFLVFGNACSPDNTPVTEIMTSAKLGHIAKQLSIIGDRFISNGSKTDPQPFTQHPITYMNAYGGEQHTENTQGKGIEEDDSGCINLANISYPGERQDSAAQQIRVAGYSNLDINWTQRRRYHGTYDDNYLQESMPGLAKDTDLHLFNTAPEDQRFPDYFKGDEEFEFSNMNSKFPVLSGKLPPIRPRCFLQVDDKFQEIKLNFDTVCFFPTDDLGLLIHRGNIPVNHSLGKDVQHTLIAHEDLEEPLKPLEFYQEQLTLRTDPEHAWKYLLDTTPLIPNGVQCGMQALSENATVSTKSAEALDSFTQSQVEKSVAQQRNQIEAAVEQLDIQILSLKEKNMLQEAEKLDAQKQTLLSIMTSPTQPHEDGKVPDEIESLLNKALPKKNEQTQEIDISKIDFEALKQLEEKVEECNEQAKSKTEESLANQIAQLETNLAKSENEEEKHLYKEQIIQLEKLQQEQKLPPVLPRLEELDTSSSTSDVSAVIDTQINNIQQEQDLTEEQKRALLKNLKDLDLDKTLDESLDVETLLNEGYLATAHFIESARSPYPGQEKLRVQAFQRELVKDITTLSVDLPFARLHEIEVQNKQLINSKYEFSQIENCRFLNSQLARSNFARCRFNNTTFINSNLAETNFGGGYFDNTEYNRCDLTQATFGKSTLRNSKFIECKFGERLDMWLETKFEACTFVNCDFSNFSFIDTPFARCKFEHCVFNETSFVNSNFAQSLFFDCQLKATNFVNCDCTELRVQDSNFLNARFVGSSKLPHSTFNKTVVTESNFRGLNLQSSKFVNCVLDKTDFSDASASQSHFTSSSAIQCQFIDCHLDDSDFGAANLMEASFMHASLKGVSFDNACCFSSSFMHATMGNNSFNNTNLKNTILENWQP